MMASILIIGLIALLTAVSELFLTKASGSGHIGNIFRTAGCLIFVLPFIKIEHFSRMSPQIFSFALAGCLMAFAIVLLLDVLKKKTAVQVLPIVRSAFILVTIYHLYLNGFNWMTFAGSVFTICGVFLLVRSGSA